ncbi:Protein MEI2-like 1 [Raphanus sativus]|uniref:Protein MEI2-like 1 isoform X1 n=1 Tax=Raphanus sativus TaxID=3726 RepID=A0A6J0P6D8_RAPSA|nr:protein MEI2-like 1 isoform X1 [Raphanus sativus]XP_018492212.1 protein MEI2-like 1 isoform X1 [Raphanus sativus]XP_056842619.1 protein MEI2-like 1 isoform X1 [Raphanus sativus]XP_056842620.1 protein MEI2-like 1 isoform X1 [Raphanus sativus]KAJ4897468.1 Protein MEI2-like 1 [Raphanus sativus]
MPSDSMEQGGVSTPSHFREDTRLTSERQFGFLKTDLMPENQGVRDRFSNLPKSSRTPESYQLKPQSSLSGVHPSVNINARNPTNGSQWESSLFSSSLSDSFNRKLRLQSSDVLSPMSANTVFTHLEEEPSESLEEIEAQTIGNLLPDEDDLFAEVMGDVGRKSRASGDDLDDFDLFSSVGGMELDGDVFSSVGHRNGERGNNNSVGEHHRAEIPCRTILAGNISSNVEDYELKVLFEQFGDIQAFHTACKNRGFIMVSYYDIRAAQNAARALHNKLLRGTKLDIRYSNPKEVPSGKDVSKGALLINNLDSSISNEELNRMFKSYGEIKEIRRTMHDNPQIYIEFFDIRAAEAALGGLNGLEVAGKQLKLAPTCPEGTRYMSQRAAHDAEGCLPKMSFTNTSARHMGRHFPGLIASTSIDGGSMRVSQSSVGSPVNSFIERHRSLSIPIGFPPSANVISASKPVGIQEHGQPFDNSNMGIQSMPNLHPHTFSEYLDKFANGTPYKSSTTFSEMVSDGSKANEGFMIHGVDGFSGGGIGSPMNQSSRRPNLNLWSNSNTQQQNPSAGMMWPNSPSHISSIPSQRPPVTVFSRAPPVMVNMASSPVHHHIGSAPVLNSPFWDRRQAYVAESLEPPGIHIGSHGSMGFPGSSPSHPMEIGSHKSFSHIARNRMDVNAQNAVLRSPQQLSHLFPGRNPMVSMPGSFDSPSERYRNLSHRRSESSSSHADKKLYELDVERILRGDDGRTTLMLKNIPNKYTSKMLLSAIDEHCKGTYDFLYLPIDFKNKCNVGYAFINLVEPEKIVPFYKAFNGKKWEKFNSEKVATLTYARIQGKVALIAHFQNSSLMNEDKRCRPILFHTDGPNAGDQEPFPMGTNIRSRPGKPRSSSIDNHNSFSIPSVSENREEPPNGTDPFLKEN